MVYYTYIQILLIDYIIDYITEPLKELRAFHTVSIVCSLYIYIYVFFYISLILWSQAFRSVHHTLQCILTYLHLVAFTHMQDFILSIIVYDSIHNLF